MAKWKIPLYKVFTDKEDVKLISKTIKRGMDWAIGPEIYQFEKLLANYVGCKFCISFNSGTSALHAALIAVGIRPNDTIIVPSFTFISTANSALMVNAKPKFVDIEEETYGLDPLKVEAAITKNTRAIIPVHYAGLPCKILDIVDIAKRKKQFLIEDAAEALGAYIKNRMVGTFGDLSILSFAGNKVLTTGEGGAIVTNSKLICEKLKLIRSHGRLEKQNYFSSNKQADYVEMGYNWRMSSMTAALGISQLQKLDKMIDLRRKNAKYISSRLTKFKQITVPHEPDGFKHAYQLYSIRLSKSKLRDKLMEFLTRKGIMSKVYFYPIHKTPFYKKLGYSKLKNLKKTESVASQILSLPMYPGLKKEELNYIVNSISEFMENK